MPKWIETWRKLIGSARNGDKRAHAELSNYPDLPTGTTYRPFDEHTCPKCGLRHR
jgi:hypothetical protein